MKLWPIPIIVIMAAIPAFLMSSVTDMECYGDQGECYETTLGRVVDGDTVKDEFDISIRFALASAPELWDDGGQEAKEFVESICPVGSKLVVDEDDLQMEGSFGRIIANVYCEGKSLNSALVESGYGTVDTRHCEQSEFSNEPWAETCAAIDK